MSHVWTPPTIILGYDFEDGTLSPIPPAWTVIPNDAYPSAATTDFGGNTDTAYYAPSATSIGMAGLYFATAPYAAGATFRQYTFQPGWTPKAFWRAAVRDANPKMLLTVPAYEAWLHAGWGDSGATVAEWEAAMRADTITLYGLNPSNGAGVFDDTRQPRYLLKSLAVDASFSPYTDGHGGAFNFGYITFEPSPLSFRVAPGGPYGYPVDDIAAGNYEITAHTGVRDIATNDRITTSIQAGYSVGATLALHAEITYAFHPSDTPGQPLVSAAGSMTGPAGSNPFTVPIGFLDTAVGIGQFIGPGIQMNLDTGRDGIGIDLAGYPPQVVDNLRLSFVGIPNVEDIVIPGSSVVRKWPRDDALGYSSAPRIHPPPKGRRIVGRYQ